MTKRILFLLGSAEMSGGTYVILQHAAFLQSQGYEVVVALVFMSWEQFLSVKQDRCWHPAIQTLTFKTLSEIKGNDFDVAIFTWWATLFFMRYVSARQYLYFVQSIESRFYPETDTFMRQLVERTYALGVPIITEATWIQKYLHQQYGVQAVLVKNGVLKTIYQREGNVVELKRSGQLRVLVEGPFESDFKNVKRTIALCLAANVGEVWLLTSSAVTTYPGVTRVFSRVPIEQVSAIYRSCDILVKLSFVEGMFGPPLEMFHCGGTAIVYDVSGHDEYILHEQNGLVVKTHDEQQVVTYLQRLAQDVHLLEKLKSGALQTASAWPDWQQSSHEFMTALESSNVTLSVAENAVLHANVEAGLAEHIHVLLVQGQQKTVECVQAVPLYHSGYYSVTLSITDCLMKIALLFGQSYKRLLITKATLRQANGEVPVHLSLSNMANQQGQFVCANKEGALIIDPKQQGELLVEFRPIEVY